MATILPRPQLLFFDLDGTIVDSGEGIMKCARHALTHFGIEVPFDDLRKFVGPPLEDAFSDFYEFSPEKTEEAVRVFRERYYRKGINEQLPYPGVTAFLKKLNDAGYRCVITTSKMQHQAERVVGEIFPELKQYFENVFARDTAGRLHTKADVVGEAIRFFGIEDHPEKAIMIGDRKYDVEGASANGLRSIGAVYGYGSREELSMAGATYLAENYDEILNLLC